jgi:DNA replication protein DnaC
MLMEAIRRRCELYADSLPEGPLNLLLFGPSGLGKTYLLKSIAQRAGEHGYETMAFTANALLNHIRESYFARGEEVAQPYYDVPLLLIDDLGTEPLWENITLEQLFNLIAYRMENRKHTVFSTNLSLEDLKKRYTPRIYSRLMDRKLSHILQFQGQDIRFPPKS